jgi:hypothetical protein
MQQSYVQPVNWIHVIDLARRLEQAAWHNNVKPEDGARLVRLLLEFQKHVVGAVATSKPKGTREA